MSLTSILVPIGTDVLEFEKTLASILHHRPDHCEIIVLHDGSYEDPHDLVEEVNLVTCRGATSLIEFVNRAMNQVGGEYVHLVRPGVEVTEGWLDNAIEQFSDNNVAAVTPMLLDTRDAVLAAGISCNRSMRKRYFGNGLRKSKVVRQSSRILGPSSCAAFYRTSVMQEIGPIDTSLGDDYLDVEIGLSIQNLGYETRLADESRLVAEAEILDTDRSPFKAGRDAQRMIWRHVSLNDDQTQSLCRQILAFELAASIIRPSNLFEVAGRLSAKRTSTADREVRRKLESVPQQRRAA